MLPSLIVYGTVNSIVLALIAMGFSVTLGISGVANLAHGAFYVATALLAWYLLSHAGIPFLAALLLSILVVTVLGAAMYWGILLRIRGMVLSEVVATLAVGIALLEFLRWKGFTQQYSLPPFIDGHLEIMGVFVDYQRVCLVLIGFGLWGLLWLFTHHTRVGLAFRALAQDRYTALSLGIDLDWTSMLSVSFGTALAAVAAVIIIPATTVTIKVGYDVLIAALAVTVVGGLGSTTGMIVASTILGYAQIIVAMFLGSHWTMVVYLIAIIVILAVKPSGLISKFKEVEERV